MRRFNVTVTVEVEEFVAEQNLLNILRDNLSTDVDGVMTAVIPTSLEEVMTDVDLDSLIEE